MRNECDEDGWSLVWPPQLCHRATQKLDHKLVEVIPVPIYGNHICYSTHRSGSLDYRLWGKHVGTNPERLAAQPSLLVSHWIALQLCATL